MKRTRIKHTQSLHERLAAEAAQFRELAEKTPHGPQRELYMRRARQAESAFHIDDWLRSPGLRPPVEIENLKPQKCETSRNGQAETNT